MKKLMQIFEQEKFRSGGLILLGCFLGGLSYPLFLTPSHIAPGGLTGVATIFNYLWQFPVGIVSLLMNLPLFVFSYKTLGRKFAFRSLAATVLFSVFIDILPIAPLTDDLLINALFGGVLLGVGLGLILRGGATTGGTDMLAKMLHKGISFLSVGTLLFIIDFLVILSAAFTMSAEIALYSMITIYVSSKLIDMVIAGFGTAKACYIITEQAQAVCDAILADMNRGATLLHATGAYSREEREVILCVTSNRETAELKRIVKSKDPNAFMFVTDTHETLGEGFDSWNENR